MEELGLHVLPSCQSNAKPMGWDKGSGGIRLRCLTTRLEVTVSVLVCVVCVLLSYSDNISGSSWNCIVFVCVYTMIGLHVKYVSKCVSYLTMYVRDSVRQVWVCY